MRISKNYKVCFLNILVPHPTNQQKHPLFHTNDVYKNMHKYWNFPSDHIRIYLYNIFVHSRKNNFLSLIFFSMKILFFWFMFVCVFPGYIFTRPIPPDTTNQSPRTHTKSPLRIQRAPLSKCVDRPPHSIVLYSNSIYERYLLYYVYSCVWLTRIDWLCLIYEEIKNKTKHIRGRKKNIGKLKDHKINGMFV